MGKRIEETSDGLKIRDTETGNLAGSVSTIGKKAPTAKSLESKALLVESQEAISPVESSYQVYQEAIVSPEVDYGFEEYTLKDGTVKKIYRMPDYIDRSIDDAAYAIVGCDNDGNWDDVKHALGIWEDDDNDNYDELALDLLLKAYSEDQTNGIYYDFQKENPGRLGEYTYSRQETSALVSTDTATHLAMSYSTRSRIINALAENKNISKDIALSLATNNALRWHEAARLSSVEGYGEEFYRKHKAYRKTKIAKEQEELALLEASGDSEAIDSKRRWINHQIKELESFESRVVWFREQRAKEATL